MKIKNWSSIKFEYHKSFNVIIILLIVMIPRIYYCLQALPLRTLHDELATMAGTNLINSYDWTAVVSNSNFYGFGLTVLFAPIFNIFKDPIIIYRIILIICSVIQGSVSLIAYHLLKNYFNIDSNIKLIIISAISSYMVVTRGMVVYNEHGLILIFWLLIWNMLYLAKNIRNKKKNLLGSVILVLLASYALLLHTRALTFMIVVMIIVVLFRVIYKQWIINLPVLLIMGSGGYLISKFVNQMFKNRFWDPNAVLGNLSVQVASVHNFFDLNVIKAWFYIIFGQINTISLVSGGLFIAGFIILIYCFFKPVKGFNQFYFITGCFSFGCIFITVMAQSVSPGWLLGSADALKDLNNLSSYSYKAFTYVRYAGPYLGGAIMWTCIMLQFKDKKFQKLFDISYVIIWIFQAVWIFEILPKMYLCVDALEAYLPFTFSWNNGIETAVSKEAFLAGNIILFSIINVIYLLYRLKKINALMILLLFLLLYQYSYNAKNYDLLNQYKSYNKVNASYQLRNILNDEKIADEIYVVDLAEKSVHKSYYLYQFIFYNKKIIPNLPEADREEAILFTNDAKQLSYLLDEGYEYAKLDNNEYIFVKGQQLSEFFIEKGLGLGK